MIPTILSFIKQRFGIEETDFIYWVLVAWIAISGVGTYYVIKHPTKHNQTFNLAAPLLLASGIICGVGFLASDSNDDS